MNWVGVLASAIFWIASTLLCGQICKYTPLRPDKKTVNSRHAMLWWAYQLQTGVIGEKQRQTSLHFLKVHHWPLHKNQGPTNHWIRWKWFEEEFVLFVQCGNAIVCTRVGSCEWIGLDRDWSADVDWKWIGSGLDVDWSPDVANGASMQICISCSMIHSLKTTYFKVIGIKENTTLLF